MYRWMIAATLLEAGYTADNAKAVAFGDNDTTAFFSAFDNLCEVVNNDSVADTFAAIYQKHYEALVSIIPDEDKADFTNLYGN